MFMESELRELLMALASPGALCAQFGQMISFTAPSIRLALTTKAGLTSASGKRLSEVMKSGRPN
jgi:hypothetical protein